MKKYLLFILTLVLIICNVSCKKVDEYGYQIEKNINYVSDQSETADVKNVILIIGDGMGANQVEFVRRFGLAEGQKLDLDKAEYKGLVDTNCLDNYVTDSAASATAMATGVRTLYQRMGMDKDGNDLETILDIAHNNGLMTGLVTNDFLTGATPGGFSAHLTNRNLNKSKIVEDQINSTIDVIMGKGEADFFEYKEEIISKGWDYTNNRDTMNKSKSSKLLTVYPTSNKLADTVPTLSEMTEKALNVLSKSDEGFVLVIEEAHVDKEIDGGDLDGMVEAVIRLDQTLRICLNFMRTNDDTLVIVVADHETGGLIIGEGEPSTDWITEPDNYHTAVKVPVYAYGNKSRMFDNCDILNTDIFYKIKEVLGLK